MQAKQRLTLICRLERYYANHGQCSGVKITSEGDDWRSGAPLDASARQQQVSGRSLMRRRCVKMMGNNIWLVIIVIFIILVLLGVITVASR